ncbi:hypothetical protein ACA910_018487 [Epithemia clementina (nom. ined.)]
MSDSSNYGFGAPSDNDDNGSSSDKEKDGVATIATEDDVEEDVALVLLAPESPEVAEERVIWKRHHFTTQEKLSFLRVVWKKMANRRSQQEASRSINIDNKQVIKWKNQFQKLCSLPNKQAKSLCRGKRSFLEPKFH